MATKFSFFIDTNLLVYAYDRSEPAKQVQALEMLDHLIGISVLSTQVLGEFFIVLTQKLKRPLSLETARERVENYILGWPVLPITPMIVQEAVRGVSEHRLNYWDAQIWATARLNQIPVVLSEDFSHRRLLEGVRFLNPFNQGFQLPA
jgi:predicted nucleic acid-binding protein